MALVFHLARQVPTRPKVNRFNWQLCAWSVVPSRVHSPERFQAPEVFAKRFVRMKPFWNRSECSCFHALIMKSLGITSYECDSSETFANSLKRLGIHSEPMCETNICQLSKSFGNKLFRKGPQYSTADFFSGRKPQKLQARSLWTSSIP